MPVRPMGLMLPCLPVRPEPGHRRPRPDQQRERLQNQDLAGSLNPDPPRRFLRRAERA